MSDLPPEPVDVVPAPPGVAAKRNPLRTWWWLPSIGILAVAALAIALQTGGDDVGAGPSSTPPMQTGEDGTIDRDPSAPTEAPRNPVEVSAVEVAGDPLPRYEANDPAIGMVAPAFTASNVRTGETESVGGDGSARIVIFVAHWCPHCRAEVPRIVEHIGATGLPDVDLVVVSTAVDENAPNYPPSAWLESEQWPTRAVADDARQTLAAAYGLTAYPYFVVLDADETVVHRASGEITTEAFDTLVAAAKG